MINSRHKNLYIIWGEIHPPKLSRCANLPVIHFLLEKRKRTLKNSPTPGKKYNFNVNKPFLLFFPRCFCPYVISSYAVTSHIYIYIHIYVYLITTSLVQVQQKGLRTSKYSKLLRARFVTHIKKKFSNY